MRRDQSHCGDSLFCIPVGFGTLYILQSFKQDVHPPSFTACARFPLPVFQITEDIGHKEERGEGGYNCLLYKNVQWLLLTYIP